MFGGSSPGASGPSGLSFDECGTWQWQREAHSMTQEAQSR